VLAKYRILALLWTVLALGCAFAPSASAVVVRSHGQFLGVASRPGVAPAAIPGSVASAHAAAVTAAGSSWDSLNYQGGPVLHSSKPYVIFWAPSGETIPASWQSLIERYFTDVAADSTKASNVYAVARQYTDSTGFADYQQSFDSGSQVVQDVDNYPARDASNCADSSYTTCLTDGQIQTEISSVISAANLPSDGPSSASELPDGAPIYFVVLPSDVDVCFSDGSGTCASNDFCAYHSVYADGPNNVLYAAIPANELASPRDAKACQWDGNSLVQEPNSSIADVALKYISHEDNETITDPLGTGWWNSYSGYENGDNCNDEYTNDNAFLPTLGGDAAAGTLYNQLIAGDEYYLQSEWSNGGSDCEMQPAAGTITPRFGVPAGPRTAGSALTFDPSTSTATHRFTSETWNWGDGTATTFHAGRPLTTATHTYAASGDYPVTLTLVDNHGNLATTTEKISVGASPTAALTASPTGLVEGSGPVSFDASASSDTDASIVSYAWDFGDGTTAQGATVSHTYATAGTYMARLTLTDSLGLVDTATATVTVSDEPPAAAFSIGVASPEAGQSVSFDGSSSSDSDGSITSYAWSFGDGHTGSGRTPSHTYASPGTYSVTLTVTDSSSQRTTVSQQLTVLAGPTAQFSPAGAQTLEGSGIGFDATASSGGASGAAIAGYAWSFGDGATAIGTTASHAYTSPGTYTVKLTVTDTTGAAASTTQLLTVVAVPPVAVFGAGPAVPSPGQPISFDGSASSDVAGAIVSYAWDFGDGAVGSGPRPTHAFARAGTYVVGLTVVARDGQRAAVSEPVTVYAQPQATFSYSPVLPVEGVATSFSAISSGTGPGSMISSYVWSFGDGSTASGASASHAYAHEGTYRVTLTVTDGWGLGSSISQLVSVIDRPPVAAVAVLRGRPVARRAVRFSGAGSHDDDPIVSYRWRFGDGSGGVGKKISHTFARVGLYRVSLTVRDSYGQTATTTRTVRVLRAGGVNKDRPSRRRRKR
jgi:PKD repeat protein